MAIKNEKRRQVSNERYVDALQERYSKLCVIRNDFGYKKAENNKVNVTLQDVKKDINTLLNNSRNNSAYDNMVGYIFKIEDGVDKGVHVHTFFFFDGNQVKNDKFKGDQIGENWEKITKGKGSYHNCNRNNYKDNAIGMLDYRDTEKRKNLDVSMEYLVKEEQSVDFLKENKNDRTIRRGTIPKSRRNVGRPRNL